MDGDEIFVLVASTLLCGGGAVWWYARLARVDPLVCPAAARLPLQLAPALCLAGIWFVLTHYADPQVTGNGVYIWLFLAAGGGWLVIAAAFLPVLGISPWLDATEGRNLGAALVVCSALLAVGTVYAGANIGTGPTIWTTLGPAALGATTLGILWLAAGMIGAGAEAITVDRDGAAALRMSGLFLATAVILAGAVAGDWVSAPATLRDFASRGWPAVAAAVAAGGIDRLLQPNPRRPRRHVLLAGALPAAFYLLAALLVLWQLDRLRTGHA